MCRVAIFSLISLLGSVAIAGSWDFNYSGRLVGANGNPVGGPVDVEIKFFDAETAGTAVGPTKNYTGTKLSDGVFQLTIDLSAASDIDPESTRGSIRSRCPWRMTMAARFSRQKLRPSLGIEMPRRPRPELLVSAPHRPDVFSESL